MKPPLSLAIFVAFSLLAGNPAAGQTPSPASNSLTILFTDTTGPKCKDDPDEHVAVSTCPGPAGYAVQFWDEGNMVALSIAPAAVIKKTSPLFSAAGGQEPFGNKMQWVLRNGVPRAAVLRTRTRPPGDDGNTGEKEDNDLMVFAIHGAKACIYGAVDARTPQANEVALASAKEAALAKYGEAVGQSELSALRFCNSFSPVIQ